jgi:GTP-binding protein
MLEIRSVEFVRSAGDLRECPNRPLPEIAVSGRSNVGKSSLLNNLLGRKKLAHVSGTPGKTQRLNYFLVNDRFHLVDLPGYGYARAPAEAREAWRQMMQGFLRFRTQLAAVVQLIDVRHAPSREDVEMVDWLGQERLPFCLVPTKMDKLRQGERKPAVAGIIATLRLPDDQPVVPYSSHTGEGREALLAWLEDALIHAKARS